MQGLRVALGKEESKNSGLEGLIYQSQGRLIKEENEQARTPYEVLEKTKYDLNLTEKDLTFLSASYLDMNLSFSRQEWGYPPLNMKNYLPENYDKVKFTMYKMSLSKIDQAKLDFQILLNSITSEKLLKEYKICKNYKDKETIKFIQKEHLAKSIFDFLNGLDSRVRPNGKSIRINPTYAAEFKGIVFDKDLWKYRSKEFNEALVTAGFDPKTSAINQIDSYLEAYHSYLRREIIAGKENINEVINHVLKNEYKAYYFEDWAV